MGTWAGGTRAKRAEGLDVPTHRRGPRCRAPLTGPAAPGPSTPANRKVSAALVSPPRRRVWSFAILGNEEKRCGTRGAGVLCPSYQVNLST
ncbi:MAG: hypothetical protein ACLTDR_04925 [Adlercreutzia equolifaciens]